MSTILGLVDGYSYSFRPKEPSSDESIAWDLQSRQTFGSCKAYYFLGTRIQRQYISILNLLSSLISGTGSCSSPEGGCPLHNNRATTKNQRQGLHDYIPNAEKGARETQKRSKPCFLTSLQATEARQRCWKMYNQCCITGTVRGTAGPKPTLHRKFPHLYIPSCIQGSSRYLPSTACPQLISGQWVLDKWPALCTDRGPDGNCSHEYTGYHQICCLNNMIPLRADLSVLWREYYVGVDVWVSLLTP
jgi:hypothetical protein